MKNAEDSTNITINHDEMVLEIKNNDDLKKDFSKEDPEAQPSIPITPKCLKKIIKIKC